MNALKIVAASAPIPEANMIFDVIRVIVKQCTDVQVHKKEAQGLLERVTELEKALREHHERVSRTTLRRSHEGILRALENIRDTIKPWSSFSWFMLWCRSQEIAKGLEHCHEIINQQLEQLNIDTEFELLRLADHQVKLLEQMTAASHLDDSELVIGGEHVSRIRFEAVYTRIQHISSRMQLKTGKLSPPPDRDITAHVAINPKACLSMDTHADVFTGYYLGDIKVAVKRLRFIRKEKHIVRFINEFKVWVHVGAHPHILPLLGIVQVGDSIGLISPYMINGNIRQFSRNATAERLHLLAGAADGLAFLHGLSVPTVHGNVKAANILVNDKLEAVLFDFEMSKVVTNIHQTSNIHDTLTRAPSQRWAAPEVGMSDRCLDDKSDIWSFGLVMVEVFTLQIPWPDKESDSLVLEAVAKHGLRPSRPDSKWVTDEVWALMQECYKDREERPSMEKIKRCLLIADQYRKDNPLLGSLSKQV